jgi:hypothetical protein
LASFLTLILTHKNLEEIMPGRIFNGDFDNTKIYIKPGTELFVPKSNFKNCTFVKSNSSIDDMYSFTFAMDFNKLWNLNIKIPKGGVSFPNDKIIENCTFQAEIESSDENDIFIIGGFQGEDGGLC